MAEDVILAESDIEDAADADKDSDRLQEVHDRAMREFDATAVPQIPIREMMREARRFTVVRGAMWEGPLEEQFENSPRPEIDRITENLEKIEEDHRTNRQTVNFLPADGADQEDADTLNDAFRADAHITKAGHAYDNALKEGTKGGMGGWRLSSDYVDPYDPNKDHQRIFPGIMIPDADQSIYFDAASILYDHSDAKRAWVLSNIPRLDFNDKWGEDNAAPFPTPNWSWQWEWFRADTVQIAEYYEVEDAPDKLLIFTQKESGEERRLFKSELADGETDDLREQGWTLRTRSWKRKRVHKYIMNGSRILKDCGFIAGDSIPVVAYYGRVDWVDMVPHIRGYTLKKMDAQRIFNSALARMQEVDSIAPFEVPIVDPDQVNPAILDQWARGNIERTPLRLLMSVRNNDGTVVQAGPVGKVEPPQVSPTTAALLQFASSLLADDDDTTDEAPSNTSADAIELAQNRVDAKSGIYLDNMALSLARTGEIYRGMARDLYYEPGRKIDTRTLDGKHGTATLKEQVVTKDGVYKLRNDLTTGTYHVEASVQEATTTKRQKAVRQFTALASVFGPGTPDARIMALNALRNMDGEAIEDTQDWAREQLVAAGVIKPTPEEQKAIEAAQQNKAPDPQDIALQTEIEERASKTDLNKAKTVATLSKAHLEDQQANVLENAPRAPTGLAQPPETPDPVEQIGTLAGAKLKVAQANKLDQDRVHQHIRTGAELQQQGHEQALDAAQHGLAVRQQDHVENQPAKGE